MTPSEKIAIARANGGKSRGPTTPEGKAASSLNALRHGLAAASPLLPCESQESFDELLAEYMDEYEPFGTAERDLVHRMVVSKWREQRAWTVEIATLSNRMALQPAAEPGLATAPDATAPDATAPDATEAAPDHAASLAAAFSSLTRDSRTLDCLYRYENAITRRFDQALARLLQLQDRRQADSPRHLVVRWVDPPRAPPLAPAAVPTAVEHDHNGQQSATQVPFCETNQPPQPPPEPQIDALQPAPSEHLTI